MSFLRPIRHGQARPISSRGSLGAPNLGHPWRTSDQANGRGRRSEASGSPAHDAIAISTTASATRALPSARDRVTASPLVVASRLLRRELETPSPPGSLRNVLVDQALIRWRRLRNPGALVSAQAGGSRAARHPRSRAPHEQPLPGEPASPPEQISVRARAGAGSGVSAPRGRRRGSSERSAPGTAVR